MTLKEWAEHLYRCGDNQEAEYGREILELFALEERDEKLARIEDDLAYHASWHYPYETDPVRIVEQLGGSAELVDECERRLEQHGFAGGDLDDTIEDLARTVANIKETLEAMGGYEITPETDLDALVMELCQRPKYDL